MRIISTFSQTMLYNFLKELADRCLFGGVKFDMLW